MRWSRCSARARRLSSCERRLMCAAPPRDTVPGAPPCGPPVRERGSRNASRSGPRPRGAALLRSSSAARSATQALFALEHAFVRILVATDAQPVRTDPDAVARDDRLAGRSRGRRRKASPGVSVATMPANNASRPAGPRTRTQRIAPVAARPTGPVGAGKKSDGAGSQAVEHAGDVVDRIDADGLEIAAEHGLDRAIPALVDRSAAARDADFASRPRDFSQSTTLPWPWPSAARCSASSDTIRPSTS